jgi:Flp pilus assembly protein TadD
MANFEKAITFFDMALKIEPKNIRILLNKAFALEGLGDTENAQQFYDAASKASSSH